MASSEICSFWFKYFHMLINQESLFCKEIIFFYYIQMNELLSIQTKSNFRSKLLAKDCLMPISCKYPQIEH